MRQWKIFVEDSTFFKHELEYLSVCHFDVFQFVNFEFFLQCLDVNEAWTQIFEKVPYDPLVHFRQAVYIADDGVRTFKSISISVSDAIFAKSFKVTVWLCDIPVPIMYRRENFAARLAIYHFALETRNISDGKWFYALDDMLNDLICGTAIN